MDARRLTVLLLGAALTVNLFAAWSASKIDPPANDYLLHGQMVDRAKDVIVHDGWTAFQDPWFPELNGGYPLFHHYPHLPHQWTAVAANVFSVDGFAALAGANFVLVALLPLLVFVGGRWLGLPRDGAAVAALVVATARSLDGFGHTPLGYGFGGHGLYGQLWGMAFAALAFPAWVACAEHDGAGLSRMRLRSRLLLAGVLVSLVVRSSLPAGYVVAIAAFVATLALGPPAELPRRLARFAAAGAIAAVLSLGFLIPFAADLGATNATLLELVGERRDSVGMVKVLGRLLGGHYLGLVWSLALLAGIAAIGATWRDREPMERALAVALAASVVLLFGRATWGDWVSSLPLLGRFHDHRYLLGLHLLAPWLLGAAAAVAGPLLRDLLEERLADRWDPRLPAAAGVLVVVLAATTYAPSLLADRAQRRDTEASFRQIEPALDLVLEEARAAGGRVAWGPEDTVLGGTTRLSWLRRHGVETFGRPLYHYSFVHDFALYWTQTAAGGAPLTEADLVAAGVSHVLPDGPSAPLGPRLVRADLKATAAGSDLQGFAVRWFSDGLHARGQHPVLAPRGQAPAAPYRATVAIESRDASALAGLPAAEGLGEVLESGSGDGALRVRVRVDQRPAWLLVPVSWHPRWTVEIGGAPAGFGMLAPGWLGVPLPSEGVQDVSIAWRPSPWRGPWAAANIALCLFCLLAPWVGRRDF